MIDEIKKWCAEKTNRKVDELDEYDLFVVNAISLWRKEKIDECNKEQHEKS